MVKTEKEVWEEEEGGGEEGGGVANKKWWRFLLGGFFSGLGLVYLEYLLSYIVHERCCCW